MDKLDVGNKLFLELKSNPPTWWENLLRDEDLYIEIRKDNYIDVYFNGGGIIRKLKFTRGEYSGSIHFKYLLSDKAEYIKSLRRFAQIDTDIMLPGHGLIYFHEPRRRVEQVLNLALIEWR